MSFFDSNLETALLNIIKDKEIIGIEEKPLISQITDGFQWKSLKLSAQWVFWKDTTKPHNRVKNEKIIIKNQYNKNFV